MTGPLTDFELRTARALNAVLWLWQDSLKTGALDSSRWGQRQAYHDAMNAAVNCGVIENFDLTTQAVKIRGQWTSAKQVLDIAAPTQTGRPLNLPQKVTYSIDAQAIYDHLKAHGRTLFRMTTHDSRVVNAWVWRYKGERLKTKVARDSDGNQIGFHLEVLGQPPRKRVVKEKP